MKNIDNEWKSLPGSDDIHRIELPNGTVLLIRENFNNSSVMISGYLAGGSMYDVPGKLGTAYFSALALMRGTEKRNFHQIYDALESVGATLGFASNVHTVGFAGKCLAEDFPLLLQIFSECLRYPSFPSEQLELLRGQMLAGIQMRDQNTSDVSSLVFDELVFKDHPYGRPEEGHYETVTAIERQDLVDFHRAHYRPQGMVIAVVGAVRYSEVIEQIEKAFAGWNPDGQALDGLLPALQPLTQTVRRHVALAGKFQTDLVMGTLAPQRNSPDFLPVSIGNNILGQFGLMGRIGDSVREKAGLAYYAASSYHASLAGGALEVNAGVNPANLQRAIDLIQKEMQNFLAEPVTFDELQDSQSNYVGRLPLSLESNAGVAGALLNLERYQLGLNYYREYPGRVMNVTREDILQAFRRFIDTDRLCIVSAGPELVG